MKILQVNKLYAPHIGGIEKVVRDIAEGLECEGGLDMKVLVCQPKGRAAEEVYNGVEVSRAKSFGIFLSMPLSFDFFRRFRKMTRDADVLLIHSPFPLADIALRLYCPKCKVIVWWHSDIVRQKFFRFLIRPFITHTLRRADKIIAATEGHILSSAYLPGFKEKCKVIPFGLDFKQYPEQPGNSFLSDKLFNMKNKKLLFVGRLVYYKGIEVLLEAMEKVEGAELFVAGKGEVLISESVSKKVHVLGELSGPDLLKAYADCDIFVFPSIANSEAFGLVQLEAMYYGKPVINTSLPTGVPYVGVDGETGLTVKPGDSAELAGAINIQVSDDDLRKRFGETARKRVREAYNIEGMLKALFDTINELV